MRWLVVVLLLAAPARADEGARLLEAGRLDEAEAVFTAKPPSGWRDFDLCLVHYAKGEYGKAIEACYRALDSFTTEKLAQQMLAVIHATMRAQGLTAHGLMPHPTRLWHTASLDHRIAGSRERATVAAAPVEPLLAATLDTDLRGRAPPLPYRIPAGKSDYTTGYDVVLVTGALFYGKDASPFVAGLRGEFRLHRPGENGYGHAWGEYLQAPDRSAGIAAIGFGGASGGDYGERGFGADLMFSVPFGKDDRRQDVLVPGYQTAVMLAARVTAHYELDLGSITIGFHPAVDGGINISKVFSGDTCFTMNDECEDKQSADEKSPTWKWTYWMVQLGVSVGIRRGSQRYHDEHVFAPSGAR
jgi:hypothetical protein